MTDSHSNLSTYRILDAAINRASEGVRVVEDYTRMVLNDGHLSQRLKQLRHDLVAALQPLDQNKRIQSRDSDSDVGRNNKTETEYQRPDQTGVVQANMARVAQSLRTIEEFSKTISTSVAQQVEQLRYQTYTLEKAILTTMMSVRNLAGIRLYVLVNGMGSPDQLCETSEALVRAGVDMIQLRDKRLSDRELIVAGQALSKAVRGTHGKWVMNDRCDLALASGANGVHLGQDDMHVSDARRVMGPSKLIGISTHSVAQAKKAVIAGANYIGVGPVFQSETKSFDELMGINLVEKVLEEIQLPIYAIGGINQENVEELTSIGCHHIAVSSVIMRAKDPSSVARDLKGKLTRNAPV